ncbi:MAG: hypothetical protein IKH56_03205 [Oscillospiraceae bacterium]|nr:hypothetical protein [Oscillospiraceae bacterium]
MKGFEALASIQEMDDRFLDEAMEWNEKRGRSRLGIGKRIGLIAAAVVVVLALTGAGLRIFEPDLYARWIMNLAAGQNTEFGQNEWVKEMLAGPREVIYEDETFRVESLGVVRSSQTFLFSLLTTVKDGELIANKEDYIYFVDPILQYSDFCLNGQPVEFSGSGGGGAAYDHDNMPSLAENEFLFTEIVTIETETVFDEFSLEIREIFISITDRQTLTAPEDLLTVIPLDGARWTCQLGETNELPSLLLDINSDITQDGRTYHLDKIRITPFNILLYTDTEVEWWYTVPKRHYLSLDSLSIVKEDGTEAAVLLPRNDINSQADGEKAAEVVTKTFSNLIQPDEIVRISLDGQIIWEKDK